MPLKDAKFGDLENPWPWTPGFLRQLHQIRCAPFFGAHLMLGSDYSGDQGNCPFFVYGFIIADEQASPGWPLRVQRVRQKFLKDDRRMSFKNMNDGHRRQALIPFLEAAEHLEGNVITVAVSKELAYLSAGKNTVAVMKTLRARWDRRSFERMARVIHFFSLFLGAWSAPSVDVTWITDDDTIVANADRLEDMHQVAARFSGLYVPHSMGVFAMNTVAVDTKDRGFEDFVAIPDLAAGMIGEVMSLRSRQANSEFSGECLSNKSQVISDWFWYRSGSLKKTCILIDRAGKGRFGVGE